MRVLTNKIITTKDHKNYWKTRDLDWKSAYFDTHNHPHRDLLIGELRKLKFNSVIEVGCAAGANLYRIKQAFPNVLIGGVDLNEKATETARNLLPKGTLIDTMSADDLFFNSKHTDIILTDACLIYIGPSKIKKALREFKRLARKYVVLVEIYSANPIVQFLIWRRNGYFVYNYPRLLRKLGFRDIQMVKIPKWAWPDTGWHTYGRIIIARP